MKTYSSVKEAIRSGIIITSTNEEEEEEGARTNYLRRRHTVDGPSFAISSTTIRLNPDNAPSETLDVSQYTQEDLKRLKEEDPFFYFSIPEIRLRSYRVGYYLDGIVEEEGDYNDKHNNNDDDEERSQDDDNIMEIRSYKHEKTEQGNVTKNAIPSPSEKRSHFHSTATATHQQTTKGRRATCPPNFLQQSAVSAGGFHHHSSLQVPLHQQGPVIKKSRRLSVEAHPDLIVESMFLEEGVDDQVGWDDNISLNEVDYDSDMEEDLLLRIFSAQGLLQERKEEEKEVDE
mmetsp:Transcript_30609/g.47949  ORF Transcript_30609/g.47949 Transcript_30609/m.47949 type:complete len:288 (+) Transcript_30609:135-998(+)|eukprot:CAMPEP_0201721040 /NCGR_PEP_ID=MMETSP0593-20130828/5834_1 /ASSEMBLY_ACC=CAM_ASM_000672 /TAXON_ID=267983 /ORGANISM="Skeletonema japonicum, Strain CCMP2506" /LENGTH=287 /DNA_ID=CAMNT_0048211785 /DNA_START=140 /DNA_END=1003 /DNA_ORIENTATION=+